MPSKTDIIKLHVLLYHQPDGPLSNLPMCSCLVLVFVYHGILSGWIQPGTSMDY